MAELAKKLYIKKDGKAVAHKIYSTAAEAGANYIRTTVDGVNGYIPVCTVGVNSSAGRVQKDGTIYALATSGKPPYTEKSWTTPGTYTFTVPQGVKRLRIALCGGGSCSVFVNDYKNEDYEDIGSASQWTGKKGGDSSFGDLKATGGSGGVLLSMGEDGGSYSAKGGTPNGKDAISPREAFLTDDGGSLILPENGFALSFTKQKGDYGKAGDFSWKSYDIWNDVYIGGTGATGGYYSGYLDVNSGETYKVVVGEKGAFNDFKPNDIATFFRATAGFVLIAFGGDI